MSVTTRIDSFHGVAAATVTTASFVYYNRTDGDAIGTTAEAIGIPLTGVGENFSWRRYFKINFTSTPTTKIANLRFYTNSPPAGIHHYATMGAAYTQPGSNDESGVPNLTDNQTNRDSTNETNHTTTNPLVVNGSDVLLTGATGYGTQDYVLSQASITDTYDPTESPTSGQTSTVIARYRYQES